MAKLMANIGMGAKMNEYDKDLIVEMIFLTPAVSVLNKDQVLSKPRLWFPLTVLTSTFGSYHLFDA